MDDQAIEQASGSAEYTMRVVTRYATTQEWKGPLPDESRSFADALMRHPDVGERLRKSSGGLVVDVSANNLALTTQIAEGLDQLRGVTTTVDRGKAREPVRVVANDISYTPKDGSGQYTRLGDEVIGKVGKFNGEHKHVSFDQPVSLDARNINEAILGGKADLVVDRLGAVWHSIDAKYDIDKQHDIPVDDNPKVRQELERDTMTLLHTLSGITAEGGSVVFDNYDPKTVSGAPEISTGQALRTIFKLQSSEDMDQFFGMFDLKSEEVGSSPSDKMLLLHKLPSTKIH